MDYEKILNRIMATDENIRFAAICNMNGDIEWNSKRNNITNILSLDETKKLLKQAVNSWKSRNELAHKLGKGKYVLAAYENLRRLTMPLDDQHILLATIDNKGGQADIIERIEAILSRDYTRPQ
jgi:hypothetical protein